MGNQLNRDPVQVQNHRWHLILNLDQEADQDLEADQNQEVDRNQGADQNPEVDLNLEAFQDLKVDQNLEAEVDLNQLDLVDPALEVLADLEADPGHVLVQNRVAKVATILEKLRNELLK